MIPRQTGSFFFGRSIAKGLKEGLTGGTAGLDGSLNESKIVLYSCERFRHSCRLAAISSIAWSATVWPLGQQKATRVIVAVNDVKLGSVLRDADLSTTDISGPVPKGAILKRQDAIGRGVVSDLYQGEPILESRLAAVGSGGGLAATIRQGMRACAVKVDEVVGVAGFVTPGMRVDVLISGNPPGPVNPPREQR